MTSEERRQIMDLRKQGFGYKRISEALNLSLGTVKSFCRRNENPRENARPSEADAEPDVTDVKPDEAGAEPDETDADPDEADAEPSKAVAESDEAVARPSEIDAQADETYAHTISPAPSTDVSSQNDPLQAVCLNCGVPVHVLPGKRPRQFCSDSCRVSYWRGKAKPKQIRRCAGCGAVMMGRDKRRKYCGYPCYSAHRLEGGTEQGGLNCEESMQYFG